MTQPVMTKGASAPFFIVEELDHSHHDLKWLAQCVVVRDISIHEWLRMKQKFIDEAKAVNV